MKYALPVYAIVLMAASSAEAAVTAAPHRAIYDLTLLRAGKSANLQSASGRLAFELQGSSCEGFTVSFRMVAKYHPSEGSPTLIDTQSTTYEGPGGLDFRHQVKELVNGEVRQEAKLKLTRTAAGQEGQGEITSKSGETFTVPGEAYLPMQHQFRLMSLGESGGGRDSSLLYDGSDGAKTFQAISFVGRTKKPGTIARDAAEPVAAPLRPLSAWPVTVSYFSPDKDQSTPDYQVSFDLYQNGVATGLVLDYGDFALSGKLADLTLFEVTECP